MRNPNCGLAAVLWIRINLMRIRIGLITLMRIRIRLFTLMRIRIRIQILAIKKAQTLEKVLKYAHIPHILACHLQIDMNPDSVPDPAYHYYADPDSDFYLMRIRRMRIQVTKMIRIHADPYLQYWLAVHDYVPVRIRV